MITIVLFAIAGGLFFAENVPSASPQDQQRVISDDFLLNRKTLDGPRATNLDKLMGERASGVPFAVQEIEVLDAFEAGLSITSIEADVVISRVLYDAYVAGKPLEEEQRNVLDRYRTYNGAHARDTVARNAELNANHPEAKGTLAPDGSRDWDLYSDPELFNQLSSAYQNRLERIYGHKGKVRLRTSTAGVAVESPNVVLVTPPNTLVNDPTADTTTLDTQSETTLVLGAGNTIISAFNDSGSNLGAAHFTGIARSTDAGDNWTDQGTLPNDANGDAGDPVLARNNTTGTIILATLGFNQIATLPTYRSTDDGVTYGAPVDGDGGGGNNDKEWLTCDNFVGAGQGNFYMFYRDYAGSGGMSFTRSTDSGATWAARQVLASASGQGAWVTVDANHTVYCFWLATGNQLVFRKSTDLGLTFGAQMAVATLRTTGINGDLGLGGGFRSNAFIQVVPHPTDANQLYAIWNDKGISPSTDKANIYLSQTTNGGTNWSTPVQVNTDAGTNDNWQPCIAITPDGTGLFVSWYDRRLSASNNLIDVFGRNATISGTTVTFGPDYRITDESFPVVIGQDAAIVASYMGDYDQAVANNTNFYRTWGDNRLPLLKHANQPDVRFTKIPKAGPGAIMAAASQSITAESCTPLNNALDPGETVTVSLGVINFGTVATTNLVGTLQATGGVTNPSGPAAYGIVAVGATATQNFTFTATGTCGATVTATLQLQDGATNLGTITYTFLLGVVPVQTFSNPAAITINDNAVGAPYPSNITVSGVSAYSRVTLTLNNLSHTFPEDIDIIVVAPGGQTAYVISDVSGDADITGVTLTLDDNAATTLGTGAIQPGTFKPSNIDTNTDTLPAPAPPGPYATTFAGFVGLGAGANGTWSLYVRDDVGQDFGSIAGGWSLAFISPVVCSTSCAASPTPTPMPPVSISGTVLYCPNPVPGPVPNVTLTRTGTTSGSTLSNASGNYTFSSLPFGGSYTVTPTKADRPPASPGINTVDVIAAQRHFLGLGTPLSGCKRTAADVTGDGLVNTPDVIAIQRFTVGNTTGIANVGKYKFTPVNRLYPNLMSNQTAQNFDTLVLGDAASTYVERLDGGSAQDAADDGASVSEVPAPVAALSLPNVAVDQSMTNFIAAVTTSLIDATNNLVGFQGDFTFDERVVAFQSEPVQRAGITGSGNWNVAGNVLPGPGPIRTLRISAYSTDFAPLSGSGTLFEVRMTPVGQVPQSTPLLLATPDQFIFIDADLKTHKPGNAAPGSVTLSEGHK